MTLATLTSNDYRDLALLVTRKLLAFMQRPSCDPPVDIVIVGSNDDIVAMLSTVDGVDLEKWGSTRRLLTARFPIKVSFTDAQGYCETFVVESEWQVHPEVF